MGQRVGIPQALLYYKYFPMWRAFFETLGHEVVVSPPTNKAIVKLGTRLGENELCLPVKIHFGHVAWLDGKVDVIFTPRIVSVDRREYTCPKFLALPDLTRVHGFTTPLLAPTFNLRLGRGRLYRDLYALARELGAPPAQSVRAVCRCLQAHRAYQRYLREGRFLRVARVSPADGRARLRIGVAGHPYNVFDPLVSQQLVQRLAEHGMDVLTPEMVTAREIEDGVRHLPKPLFWTYEKEVVGAVGHWVRHDLVDGVIYLLSFACGPDSLIQLVIDDTVRHQAARPPVPLLCLVIDEHSGEAGFVTRLEAFLDLLSRKAAA